MSGGVHNRRYAIDLQGTLAASSAGAGEVEPHHPICCPDDLELDEEFRCPHAAVPLTEERTVYCLQHTVAILLIELAARR